MKIKELMILIICLVYNMLSFSSMKIGEHRKPKPVTEWVSGEYPKEDAAEENITTSEMAQTTTTTKPNILQQGIKTIKNILNPTPSEYSDTNTYSNYTDYGYRSSDGLGLGGGAGSVNVNTGDITIGDIKALVTNVTKCENSISSGCGAGSVCNVTVGPCSVTTSALNAAPTELSFTRYLVSNNATVITVKERMESKIPQIIPLQLTAQNNYTMIIKYKSGGLRDISYMIIALPTEKNRVDAIKNLPVGLRSYLKRERGTIIKIYQCSNPDKNSTWSEVSEQKIDTSLSDKIVSQSNIINVEITGLGTLAVTYRNMKNNKGETIPVTRAEYTYFVK